MMRMKHENAYISGNHDVLSLQISQKLSENDLKISKMHAKTVRTLDWHEPKNYPCKSHNFGLSLF